MAAPFGTNELNSISRRYIMPTLVDNVYKSNLMFFRLNARNKKVLQGGLQIEVPLVYSTFGNGGSYQGFDLLDVAPNDTVKNGAWDWKQYYSPVSVDGLTLIRADSPEAIVNFLSFYFENAQTDLADKLGYGCWMGQNGTKAIDGIRTAVDDGTNAATYGGLLRSSNTWWKSSNTIQAANGSGTTALSLATMNSSFLAATEGGRHPTIIVTTNFGWSLYWALSTPGQSFPVQPGGHDEQLAQNGFTNLLFNNVPVVMDSHCPNELSPGFVSPVGATVSTNGKQSEMYFLNEDYMYLFVNPRADFNMKEFREPVNQDAMTSLILWAGNIVFSNVGRQAKIVNINA